MNRKMLCALIAIVLVSSACGANGGRQNETSSEVPGDTPMETLVDADEIYDETITRMHQAPKFNLFDSYEPLTFEAKAPDYTIQTDLSNIANIDQFPNLTQEQRALIAQNGFVVTPTNSEQLFYIYEDNTYKKIPSFVTVDSVLQLYHVFFDYSLRNIETNYLYDDLSALNQNMIRQLMADYALAKEPQVQENILKSIGYFGVAHRCLGNSLPVDFPSSLISVVDAEVALINGASGIGESPLFGVDVDYSLFTVRGHYTRTEELGRFSRAMSWYGVIPFAFYDTDGNADMDAVQRAVLTSMALYKLPAEQGKDLWENIYTVTSYYVGESDDILPSAMMEIVSELFGEMPNPDALLDRTAEILEPINNLNQARIVSKATDAVIVPQMRFMGQRYIPDSEILQNLSDRDRPFPTGVDVFAVFGSERAEEVLEEIYQPTVLWPEYETEYNKLKDQFSKLSVGDWTKNLYSGWLYSLNQIVQRKDAGYPLFMQNRAWEDKSLNSALGSWAEIRHDTILYGKQSGAECGGGAEPPEIINYVEPDPEFFNRLLWLTANTRENLAHRGYLSYELQYKMETFETMLQMLRDCALKELNGEDLSLEENYTLLTYGGTLEYLTASIAEASGWYLVESDTDRNMAVVADVHTAAGQYLEVAVGAASEIYVAIPQNGKVYLTRGAVFDYFEFVSDERLTDEAWQAYIKERTPPRPPFTESYMDNAAAGEIPLNGEPYTTGC